MTLDREYFNKIGLEAVRKKYYGISEVDSLLVDIRARAEALIARNEALEKENAALRSCNEDLRMKGQVLSQEILSLRSRLQEDEARAETPASAAPVTAAVQQDPSPALAARQQEYIIRRAEAMYSGMKDMHEKAIEDLNRQWQEFLCDFSDTEAPEDLGHKIGLIAREIYEIEKD